MEAGRERWGSKFGFLAAAVGAAIGLGNIWGFPYRMGENGGFAFLLVYVALTAVAGIPMLACELAIGRMTRSGADGAFRALSKRFRYVGLLAVGAAFLVTGFYNVLGGYCVRYFVFNLTALLGANMPDAEAAFESFVLDTRQVSVYSAVFAATVLAIVSFGVSGGIEKFSKFAMPALTLLLVAVVIRALTLDGAEEGLRFMFDPDLTPLIEDPLGVITTAGEQMFFSLSLGVGCMIIYGSYLPSGENIMRSATVIAVVDGATALLAGMAVLPAAFALGGEGAQMSGPALLFVTMQRVFDEMGRAGAAFGVLFYALTVAAAVSSGVSFVEVAVSFAVERAAPRRVNRTAAAAAATAASMLLSLLVASDALGLAESTAPFGGSWMAVVDITAEGIMIPLCSLCTALAAAYELKPERIEREIERGGGKIGRKGLFRFALRVAAPAVMLIVLWGQIQNIVNS